MLDVGGNWITLRSS